MISTAHIRFDRDYFELQYDEWLRHRSRLRKYEIWFASALTLAGLSLSLTFPLHWLVGAVFMSAGICEFAMAITHRRRWVNARTKTARADKAVDLEFGTDSLTSVSENGMGTMRYSGFVGFTTASRGFFLVPDTGISIYVPRDTIAPSDSYSTLIELLSSTIERAETENHK